MVSERDRIISVANYLESLGIEVNIGKNKARGNRGIFLFNTKNQFNRIDISNTVKEEKVLQTIIHEYSHYIHRMYDSAMNSLDFVFGNYDGVIENELINITVNTISKITAKEIFAEKEKTTKQIKEISNVIKSNSVYKSAKSFDEIKKSISYPLKYLANYDKVKIFNKNFSIENIDEYSLTNMEKQYLILKSKQRKLRRINSKISKLNKYYIKPSELFARFAETYFTDINTAKRIAPESCKKFEEIIKSKTIPEFYEFSKLLN